MESYILGVDVGTGSVKTVVVDFTGNAIYSSQHYYSTLNPRPGFSEQDPEIITDAFIKSITETVIKLGIKPAAVSLSSAMHSIMAIDANGLPLSQLIIWSDSRSAAIARQIRNSQDAVLLYHNTGMPIHSMSPLCKIIWIRENYPEVFQKTSKFISIKEYIWYRLFQEFRIDHSIASATGLFDIENLTWNTSALNLAGIRKDQLSIPVATNYKRTDLDNKFAGVLNVSPNTVFCIGASDGCLANLGTHSLQPGVAVISIGTSGAVRLRRSKPFRDFSIMSFNYVLDENNFICGGPVNNGGNIVQWLLKNFLSNETVIEDHYRDLFERIEKTPAGCEGLIFLPYLNGERAPVWDELSCGVFFGIKPQHNQSYFLRAALEGICFALKNILTLIEDSSEPIDLVNVTGGFVQSMVWIQLLSDITEKKISLQQTEDASAIGAAYLGLKALNIISNYSSLKSEDKKYIYPRKQFAEVYEKNYKVFKTLYPSLKDSMHLLLDNQDSV